MEIAFAIVAAEIAFWLLVLSGMTARYVWHRERLSTVLLVSVPLADVALLAFTAIDLAGGAEATVTHGLAALYLGFSVALGPVIVAATDRRFAKRPRERLGAWRLWARVVAACAIAAVVLLGLALIADDPDPLLLRLPQLGVIAVGWLILGPVWDTVRDAGRRAAMK
jgi:hypothetical protein